MDTKYKIEQMVKKHEKRFEIYEHMINNKEIKLEDEIKALFDIDYVNWCSEDSMPTLCQALLDSGTEMTQKFHTLARRGANGDTRWMYDSYGYERVQFTEFYDRYFWTYAQADAMRKYWLDRIRTDYSIDWSIEAYGYEGLAFGPAGDDDFWFYYDFGTDHDRACLRVDERVSEWTEGQHELAIDEDQRWEQEREYERREQKRRDREMKAAQLAKEERQRREQERQKREEMRSLKHQQKVSYMISLMA